MDTCAVAIATDDEEQKCWTEVEAVYISLTRGTPVSSSGKLIAHAITSGFISRMSVSQGGYEDREVVKHRDVILLWLTVLQQLLDNVTDYWVQVREAAIHNRELWQTLVALLSCEEHFVSYSARKTLLAMMRCANDDVGLTSELVEQITDSLSKQEAHVKSHIVYLDLCTDIIADQELDNTGRLCLGELHHRWQSLLQEFLSLVESDCTVSEPLHGNVEQYLLSFLSLWNKIIQLSKNREDSISDKSFMSLEFCQNLDILWPTLVEGILVQNSGLLKKVLDLYNSFLTVDNLSPQLRNVASKCVSLCNTVLQSVKRGLFTQICVQRGFAGFGGRKIDLVKKGGVENDEQNGDLVLLRKLSLLVLKSGLVLMKSQKGNVGTEQHNLVQTCMQSLNRVICKNLVSKFYTRWHWIVHLFNDQDDVLLESMLFLLDLYTTVKTSSNGENQPYEDWIPDPHELFIDFLHSVSHDHSILLDFLISPETCFLIYLLHYLKLVQTEWHTFLNAHEHYTQQLKPKDLKMDRLGQVETSGGEILNYPEAQFGGELPECTTNKNRSSPTTDTISTCALVDYSDSSDENSDQEHMDSLRNHVKHKQIVNNAPEQMEYSPNILQNSSDADLQNTETDKQNEIRDQVDMKTTVPLNVNSKTSSETCEKTSNFLHVDDSRSNAELDKTMSTLIRLRLSVERLDSQEIFPYNAKPLLKHLCRCEDLYEQ